MPGPGRRPFAGSDSQQLHINDAVEIISRCSRLLYYMHLSISVCAGESCKTRHLKFQVDRHGAMCGE